MISRIQKAKKYLLNFSQLAGKRGFTLIETLMAILVLMIALTGPYTIAEEGLQATLIAKDQDTAIFLAQDAVEYVRWVRDTNRLQGDSDWLASLDGTSPSPSWTPANSSPTIAGGCTGGSGCTLDSVANTITACSGTCSVLDWDSTNNRFSYTSGTATTFVRTVTLSSVTGNTSEEAVNVSVTWSDPQAHTITVREDIFNWQ